jgi:SSS family solute:Na+ symporter
MEDVVAAGATGLAPIDLSIVILFMVGTLGLGTYFGKYVKSGSDFFVGGRALPFWAIGMSVVVSDIGAMDFIAVAGETYNSGIAVPNFDWIGSMPAMVFAAFIFVPYYWRAGVYTIPEFLGKRYNPAVQLLHAAIWGCFLFVSLSVMLWVVADQFLHGVLGWNPTFSVWLIVALAGVYTFSGGLSAVVMTDVVQLIIMFVGGFALLILSISAVGGWDSLKEKVMATDNKVIIELNSKEAIAPEAVQAAVADAGFGVTSAQYVPQAEDTDNVNRFLLRVHTWEIEGVTLVSDAIKKMEEVTEPLVMGDPHSKGDDTANVAQFSKYDDFFTILLPHNTHTAFPWTGIVFGLGIVMATAYMSGNQAIVQRTLGARTEWDCKGGMLFAGFLKSFIPLMVAIPGLAAIILLPDLDKGEDAVPGLMKMLLPPGLKGLMFAALFAALMSSVDSTLNSASTIWTTDLYGRVMGFIRGESLDEKHQLVIGRMFTVIFILLAGFLAKSLGERDGIYNFLQSVMSLFQGPIFAILLLGIMWRRATQWGGLAGLVLGICFTFILTNTEGVFVSEAPYLFVAWWSFVFSLIVTVVVSYLTPNEPDEKVRGLIFGQLLKDGKMQRVLQGRVDN